MGGSWTEVVAEALDQVIEAEVDVLEFSADGGESLFDFLEAGLEWIGGFHLSRRMPPHLITASTNRFGGWLPIRQLNRRVR